MSLSTRTSVASLLLLGGLGVASALSERDTLVRLYNLANGRHWVDADGWRQASEAAASGGTVDGTEFASVCSWHGVTCGTHGDGVETVTELDLSYNHLSGKVSHHLWTLPNLKVANLHGNLLTDAGLLGFADDASGTKSPLEKLYLSENRLTSLEGLSSVPTTLRHLHVGSNAFEGHFPEEVFRLKKLHGLRASYNAGFTGTLSSQIGDMTNLKELELSYTGIRGEIPTELGALSNLEFLSLDNNRLHGTIPFELEDLIHLKYLSIQNSEPGSGKLTGKVPAFRDAASLKELYFNDNGLTGTIPADLLEFSLLTDKPIAVGLRNNKLSGHVPSELADRFERLHLEIGGNKINGLPDALCEKGRWMSGMVTKYGCDAILCPKGTYRAESGRREGEADECEACPNGVRDAPHLGSTHCNGANNDGASTSDGDKPSSGGNGDNNNSSGNTGDKSESNYDPSEIDETDKGESVKAASPPSTTSSSSSRSSSSSSGKGMSGGAKFAVVLISLVSFLALSLLTVRTVRRHRSRREALEEAELERAASNGVVFDAADAGPSPDMGDAGMLDVPLGSPQPNGPSAPGVSRCIL